MTVEINSEGKGALSIAITGVASATAGGIGAILNPEGRSLIITRATLYIATGSTGSAAVSIGVGATATTSATDIVNALDLQSLDGKMYNGFVMQNSAKTEITAPILWTSTKYITFSGAASTVGLDATLYLEYLRV